MTSKILEHDNNFNSFAHASQTLYSETNLRWSAKKSIIDHIRVEKAKYRSELCIKELIIVPIFLLFPLQPSFYQCLEAHKKACYEMVPDGLWCLMLHVQGSLFFSSAMDGGLHFQGHFYFQ